MTNTIRELPEPTALACDVVTGQCGPAGDVEVAVRLTYVTDPICSACWAMEPAWRALRVRYADVLEVRHVYGGLLPGWEGFADPGAGIASPRDVAGHWDEIALRTGQPIDSRVWFDDPLDSSFPPSVALTAARLAAPEREEAFLRHLREQVFLRGRNIARSDTWWEAAAATGIDRDAIVRHLTDGSAVRAFENDLAAAQASGARGFPTLVVEGPGGSVTLFGTQSPDRLEQAVLMVGGLTPRREPISLDSAVEALGTGTTAEYAALLRRDPEPVERRLAATGLRPLTLAGGTAWLR